VKNLGKIIAGCDNESLQIFRVRDGVMNVTNGYMLARRQVQLKDGTYRPNRDGTVSPVQYRGFGYPDVDLMRPAYETLKPFCSLDRAVRSEMHKICLAAKERDGRVTIEAGGFYAEEDEERFGGFSYRFCVPYPISLSPNYLMIALVELHQYENVFLLKEDESAPLILGRDWGACCMIQPMVRSEYGTSLRQDLL